MMDLMMNVSVSLLYTLQDAQLYVVTSSPNYVLKVALRHGMREQLSVVRQSECVNVGLIIGLIRGRG